MSRPPSAPRSALQRHWKALAPREKNLLRAAAALIALAVLWWLGLAPALHTLQTAPSRHASLDAQWQHMQALQAQAQQLQNAPRTTPQAALDALQVSVTERLGTSARLSVVGDRATLTLQGTPADALAAWLAQARSNARTLPQEAHLTRTATPPNRPAPPQPTTPTPLADTSGAPITIGASDAVVNAGAPSAGVAPPASARWDGTLVLTLPAH
ncbi:MAG: type II secretion system protein M [Burkholderiaceae bacterium]|nr:type II secretion system protein M [Burkholderiaceae bacterium]